MSYHYSKRYGVITHNDHIEAIISAPDILTAGDKAYEIGFRNFEIRRYRNLPDYMKNPDIKVYS